VAKGSAKLAQPAALRKGKPAPVEDDDSDDSEDSEDDDSSDDLSDDSDGESRGKSLT